VNDIISADNFISLIPFGFFLAMLVLQSILPRRDLAKTGFARVLHNIFLFLINAALMRFVAPFALATVALWANQNDLGLFNMMLLPDWLVILLCVIALDFAIYWQHVATHKFPILWRLHKVHHADPNMDVSTAVRFHPIELLLSLLFKALCVLLLGAPIAAVLVFELLLFIGPAFNHSNLRLAAWLDSALRWVVATPDTHRAHHSTMVSEQDTNYGFFIIWWDKLFNTYTELPSGGHIDMAIGVESPDDQCDRIDQMLAAPFR